MGGDGWMDGWMDGWVDGWMGEWVGGTFFSFTSEAFMPHITAKTQPSLVCVLTKCECVAIRQPFHLTIALKGYISQYIKLCIGGMHLSNTLYLFSPCTDSTSSSKVIKWDPS